MEEDERPVRPAVLLSPRPLEPMGVAELQAYVVALRGEIERAEAEIVRKRDQRGAADALFGRRD